MGAIPTIMTTALMGFVKIDGSTRLPLCSIAVMTVVNIALDLAMIFIFDLGMFGIALATTIAYCCAALTACLHFTWKYNTLGLVRPKKLMRELGAMAVTGAPAAVSRICDTIKVTTLNHLLVGVAGAALLLFPSLFAGLLGVKEADVLVMATLAVQFFAVGMPFQLINTVMMNFYQSTRNTGLAAMICLLQSLAYTTGFALLLVRSMGSSGVWVAFLLGELCTLLTVCIYITVRCRRLPHSLRDILLLSPDFGGEERDRLELSIGNDMDEVMTISRGIYKFGEHRNIDPQLICRLSLCIEEMAGNVVRHVFRSGEKKWFDLMILDKTDALIIRMRDNGALFNPITYQQNHDNEQEHLGIRMIYALSDQFEYHRSIGLNNLRIVLKK